EAAESAERSQWSIFSVYRMPSLDRSHVAEGKLGVAEPVAVRAAAQTEGEDHGGALLHAHRVHDLQLRAELRVVLRHDQEIAVALGGRACARREAGLLQPMVIAHPPCRL